MFAIQRHYQTVPAPYLLILQVLYFDLVLLIFPVAQHWDAVVPDFAYPRDSL